MACFVPSTVGNLQIIKLSSRKRKKNNRNLGIFGIDKLKSNQLTH